MRERIADYVLGVLDEGEAEAVRDHVSGCEACQGYLRTLTEHSEALTALGQHIQKDMHAREDKVIAALEAMGPSGSGRDSTVVGTTRLLWTAVAAVLMLGVGITIGRLTAAEPIDVEQLRADLKRSVAASLQPALEESVDERLGAALAGQLRQELRVFGAQLMVDSEAMMDRRLDDFLELIEAARLKDRQRVAQAFEQIELNRMRDVRQLGLGLRTLAVRTDEKAAPIQN
jgi:anti-sigma factor RsiW